MKITFSQDEMLKVVEKGLGYSQIVGLQIDNEDVKVVSVKEDTDDFIIVVEPKPVPVAVAEMQQQAEGE